MSEKRDREEGRKVESGCTKRVMDDEEILVIPCQRQGWVKTEGAEMFSYDGEVFLEEGYWWRQTHEAKVKLEMIEEENEVLEVMEMGIEDVAVVHQVETFDEGILESAMVVAGVPIVLMKGVVMGTEERVERKKGGENVNDDGEDDVAIEAEMVDAMGAAQADKVMDGKGKNGGKRGGMCHNDWRILYECYMESRLKVNGGTRGYRERLLDGWVRRGMRVVKKKQLARRAIGAWGMLSEIERMDIASRVNKREGGDARVVVSGQEAETSGKVDKGQDVEVGGGLGVRVNVDRIDVWRKGDEVKLLDEDMKKVLARLREVYNSEEVVQVPSLKSRNREQVNRELDVVEGLMPNLVSKGMTVAEVNKLLYTGSFVVAERLGLIKERKGKRQEKMEPWWKRRLEGSIKQWRADLSRIEEVRRGKELNGRVKARLDERYGLVEKGALWVRASLSAKIQAGNTKIRWYRERCVQFHQNNLFRNNQSQLYKELSGSDAKGDNPAPDAVEAVEFWSGIWSVEKVHNEEAVWMEKVRSKMEGVRKMDKMEIRVQDVVAGIRRMSNWKAPGPDGVRGFWFKKFPSLHQAMADGLQDCLDEGGVPEWMVKGRTVLIQKDPAKGTVASNYRPIACLPLMWKLLTGIFAERIYDHLKDNNLLPVEQKGCRKQSRGTKDQLLIDKAVLKEVKRKRRCLSMAWLDYKKAYDMVPHSWLLEVMGMMGVAENVEGLMRESMGKWQTVLAADGKELGEVKIRRGIFQGDSLSPLLFVMVMTPLSILLKEEERGYEFGEQKRLINHLLFMDDLKLYAKTENDLGALLGVVELYSRDIGMEFGMDKCAVLTMKDGVRVERWGMELPSGEVMKEVDEEGYKYLGVLQTDKVMDRKMRDKVKAEYYRRVKLLAKSKLYAGHLVSGLNAWAIGVVRYSAGILNWTVCELQEMDKKTRRILTMNGAFHKKGSVLRLYMKRKGGGRGLISVEDCVRMEERGLWEYVGKSEEWMLKEVSAMGLLKDGLGKVDFGRKLEADREKAFAEKVLHGRFYEQVKDVADERSWQWVRGGFMTPSTEAYIYAAQEQALGTRWVRSTIYQEDVAAECRVCGEQLETVNHLASGCKELAKRQYVKRHDRMGVRVHWELCRKYGIECADKWYEHVPAGVCENGTGEVEIWWDKTVMTGVAVSHNRPDVIVIDRAKKKWTLIDFSVPLDKNVLSKENEKIEKYSFLAREVRRIYGVSTKIVPLVIGALGTVPRRLGGYLEELGIPDVRGCMQTTALLGTVRILKDVLSL